MGLSSISLLLAALTALLGGAVILSGRRRPAYLAFIWLCVNVFLWHGANIFRAAPAFRLLAVAVLLPLPLSLLRYLRTWLGEIRGAAPQRPVSRWLWALVLLLEVALFASWKQPGAARHLPTALQWLSLLGLYAALSPMWVEYRRTLSRAGKRRLLYLLGLGVVAVTLTATDFLDLPSPYSRQGGPAVGTILTLVYLYFLQQNLFFDRLLDINELLGKVVVLSALVLLILLLGTGMALLGLEPRDVVTLVVFVTVILFEPLRSRLEARVGRFVARERYELKQHLMELRVQLSNIIDLRDALRRMLDVLDETRRMTHASVYLMDGDGGGFDLAGHFGSHPVERLDAAARRPLLDRLRRTRRALTLEQLEQERLAAPRWDTVAQEEREALERTLAELSAGACIGIFGGDGGGTGGGGEEDAPLGLLCVKDERAPDAFSLDELEQLEMVAAQLGITLQNSRLYERMKERDRLAALGEMAAGLAHEIRNPLGAIKGAAELLAPRADGRPSPMAPEEAAGIIVEETRRLSRVVSQFLDYARPYRGEMQLVTINEVIHKTLPLCTWPDAGGRVELELAPDLPRVRADPEQLRQVFLNLALNAMEAVQGQRAGEEAPRPGLLTISTGLRRGRPGTAPRLEIRFADNGPGVSAGAQKNLFIPFFTTKERGTGLGLPISQRIIENHGGHIEVRSRPDVGATFTVVLPVAEGGHLD